MFKNENKCFTGHEVDVIDKLYINLYYYVLLCTDYSSFSL